MKMNDLQIFLICFWLFFTFTCIVRWYILKDLNQEERKKCWEELKDRYDNYR